MSPAKDAYYPVGGRVLRGITAEESLRKKALDECSLKLFNIRYLTTGRTIFKEEPFGHGKGTDTINLIFIADGEGTGSAARPARAAQRHRPLQEGP
jgi:ADP-ribose pyrophosphatase YjhB (NUDIX family)